MQAAVRQHMFLAVPNTHHQIKILTTVQSSRIFQLTFSSRLPANTAFILNMCAPMTRYFVTEPYFLYLCRLQFCCNCFGLAVGGLDWIAIPKSVVKVMDFHSGDMGLTG